MLVRQVHWVGPPLVWPLPVRWTCEGDGLAYKLNPAWFPTNKGK